MGKLISNLFPIRLHLNILQLEEYDARRYGRWILRHIFHRGIEVKKPLTITLRIKIILLLSLFFLFIISVTVFLIFNNFVWPLLLLLLLIIQPYILLILATITLKPFEHIMKYFAITKNRKIICRNKKMKIIAITGSFGKSSIKEILYQLINKSFRTIRTPESFNTILGIDKFLKYEMDNNYEYFICEMAAYRRGEIKDLCRMIPPTYGILTGITGQHLDRFKSLDNVVSAKFELVEAVPHMNNLIFNLNSQPLLKELQKRNIAGKTAVDVQDIRFDKNGSSFTIIISKRKHPVKTTLFGMSQVKNILMAAEMALKIGLKPHEIVKRINQLVPMANRSLVKEINHCQVVDNTFSSNIESFRETIETAKKIEGKKFLVTPGIVELGRTEKAIHQELGNEIRDVFDKVILVGKNPRTLALAKGINQKNKTEFIDDNNVTLNNKVIELTPLCEWIFLENDITQNY